MSKSWLRSALVGGLVGGLLATSAVASAASSSWVALQASKGIVIDGNLDDWGLKAFGDNPTVVLDPATSWLRAGEIKSAENSGQVYVMYDSEYLYIGADITDDNVVGDNVEGGIWQNSAVEVWINAGDLATPSSVEKGGEYGDEDYQINLAVMSGGELQPTYYVFPGNKAAFNDGESIKVGGTLRKDGTGYVLEVRLPLAKFPGLTGLKAGSQIKLAISTVHIDKEGAWGGMFSPGPGFVYALLTFK